MSVSRDKPDPGWVAADHQPKSVMLDFVDPTVPTGQPISGGRKARLNKRRHAHGRALGRLPTAAPRSARGYSRRQLLENATIAASRVGLRKICFKKIAPRESPTTHSRGT